MILLTNLFLIKSSSTLHKRRNERKSSGWSKIGLGRPKLTKVQMFLEIKMTLRRKFKLTP